MTAFDAARLSLTDTQLIEASAGTGKTYTITNLCLRLLLGRGIDRPLKISEILILTFTIAATAELKQRITQRILSARQAFQSGSSDPFLRQLIEESTDPERDRKLLTAASQLMDEASIFTIHGFCARVLGEQAFEAGSLFTQTINAERDPLLKLVSEDCFRLRILPLPPGIREIALGLWATPAALARKLSPLLFRGPLTRVPVRDRLLDYAQLLNDAQEARALWLSEDLSAVLRNSELHKGKKPYKHLDRMNAWCSQGDPDLQSDLWQIYSSAVIESGLKTGHAPPESAALTLIDSVNQQLSVLKTNLWHDMLDNVAGLLAAHKIDWQKQTLDDLLTTLADAVKRSGSSLPGTIAARWPVAMIDEFQDTDDIQNSIFSRVYLEQPGTQNLLMIGDPKQAIYNFRGADIYTYINARRTVDTRHNLSENWRSTPDMINATNYLFDQPDVFGNDGDIPFVPVAAPEAHQAMQMTLDNIPQTPYALFVSEGEEVAKHIASMRAQLMRYAAIETARLLSPASDTLLDDAPLQAGQIAFLVRRRTDAALAKQALSAVGIKSVYLTMDSVLQQATAADLQLILAAALEPANDRAIRSALACRLMQTTASEIDLLSRDRPAQQAVFDEFCEYFEIWRDKGIAPMLERLMQRRQLAQKWLPMADGERQLTNVRHLTELLQHRASLAPGMHQLLKWFTAELQDDERSEEQNQLRLESDDNLVKIVTMHAAKGLEYDVVMIPVPLVSERPARKTEPVLFHTIESGYFQAAIELGDNPEHREQAARETSDEEMRLLYVALTRARYRCYLGVPAQKGFARSALAKLLRITTPDQTNAIEQTLRETLPPAFEVSAASDVHTLPTIKQASAASLTPPLPAPTFSAHWRIHSYTSVVSRLGLADTTRHVSGFSDDDTSPAGESLSTRNRFSFPRGTRVGVALHSLMEDVDFCDDNTIAPLSERTIKRLGLETHWQPTLTKWISDVVQTPLGDCCLADISRADRLDEMEFHFPLDAAPDLIAFLRDQQVPGIAERDAGPLRLQGLMTGLVDLTFRHNNRYYIADYKSNYLGPTASHYGQQEIAESMTSHQYHLQYLIYTVAVHRLLAKKIAGYDYDTHFGGVYYLFMRGMNTNNSNGVFSTRPSRALIEQLDVMLGGQR